MKPAKVNLAIYQGASFRWPFYWYSDVEKVVPITGVLRTYPTKITAVAHALPSLSTVPVALLDVPDWLVVPRLPLAGRVYATRVDADNFTVEFDGTGADAYSGSAGRLVYNVPMDVSSYDARMQVRASIDDATPIVSFTVGSGHIALATDGSIILTLGAADTDTLDFDSAVYDLELIDIAGVVTRLAAGKVTLSAQVTR